MSYLTYPRFGSSARRLVGSSARRLVGSLTLVASALMTNAFTSSSWAQAKPPSRYDVIDIGDIPTESGWHSFKYWAFAINENNSVAGWVEMRIPGYGTHIQHAIFWTPDAEHGFSPFTLYDLTDLAGLSPVDCPDGVCKGFGYDINDADIVVGTQFTEWGSSYTRGFIWDLPTNDDSGGLQLFAMESLMSSPPDGDCVLHGINDASPPVIVGEADDELGGFSCSAGPVAFRATFNGTPGTKIRLDSANGSSAGLDLNEAGTLRASGQAKHCGSLGGCQVADSAQHWVVGGAVEALDEGGFNDTVSRAVNNAAQACGDSGEITENACPPQALFWDSDGTLTVIGDPAVVPDVVTDEITQAWGISPSSGSLVNVVGSNNTLQVAWLWHRNSSGDWAGYDLNYRVVGNCPLVTLQAAYDINGSGWIVGYGKDCDNRQRGFVLRPAVCPSDLDFDCDVDATDLSILLGAWSATPSHNETATMLDLDQGGSVGSADLAILLGAWGQCDESCVSCSGAGCEEAMMSGANSGSELSMELLTFALSAQGFGSVAALNEWLASASVEDATIKLDTIANYILIGLEALEGGAQ